MPILCNLDPLVNPNDRFGMLVAEGRDFHAKLNRQRHRMVVCRCDCGGFFLAYVNSLNRGQDNCGCQSSARKSARAFRHGGKRTTLYTCWLGIKHRCTNKNYHAWKDYGGRGIVVCSEWISDFAAFRDWALSNGYAEGLEIDRIKNDGNYEPSNCRWVEGGLQVYNRRKRTGTSSSYRGVGRHAEGKWQAYIGVNGKFVYLGLFTHEIDAAMAYDEAAKRHYGANAMLNLQPQVIE